MNNTFNFLLLVLGMSVGMHGYGQTGNRIMLRDHRIVQVNTYQGDKEDSIRGKYLSEIQYINDSGLVVRSLSFWEDSGRVDTVGKCYFLYSTDNRIEKDSCVYRHKDTTVVYDYRQTNREQKIGKNRKKVFYDDGTYSLIKHNGKKNRYTSKRFENGQCTGKYISRRTKHNSINKRYKLKDNKLRLDWRHRHRFYYKNGRIYKEVYKGRTVYETRYYTYDKRGFLIYTLTERKQHERDFEEYRRDKVTIQSSHMYYEYIPAP